MSFITRIYKMNIYLSVLLIALSSVYTDVNGEPLGVVVWHGMGDSGFGGGVKHLRQMIMDEIPGTYVLDVEIGSSSFFDRLNSFFMPVNKQLNIVCDNIHSNPHLSRGFHLIGFSQGGLFVRALAQRCPPAVLGSVISIGGPQQGVFGMPFCPNATSPPLCSFLRNMLSKAAYTDFVQSHFVQAQYWHDPFNEALYSERSQFLAEINQEKVQNRTYKDNLLKAANLVLVRFMHDTTVIPGASEWFGFYRSDKAGDVYDIKESKQYKTDSLGLKTLDEQGRLHLIPLPGYHLQFSDEWFRRVIIGQFLRNRI
ncbi:Palmitoyl-protein thioesterase [Echinococcus granulosus]|uniref:Palmitoyl-protein thioesterase 1 n=2 Tax=Echinococcus granulosus TaxID=6210 RepID=W6UQB6_ECHGR|nr:Palmitoyl-protein thioesterase [Echinococcus granulosus]EUB63885.1 Palmitoyl-protein thioesterase [Echinococcus granulosus]